MNKMKFLLSVFCILCFISCNDLNIEPMNIVQDKDIFTSEGGVNAYMASLYEKTPMEDFKYSANNGFNHYNVYISLAGNTGEMISKRINGVQNPAKGYWGDAYSQIRYINYFIKEMPNYSSNFSEERVRNFLGEAYFLRAYTYFALAKRYGGVPIITEVQQYPDQSLEELQLPRNKEAEVYDLIARDLDQAISLLGVNSVKKGRVNKYIAAAFKSRAMLHAGSIAKYGNGIDVSCPQVGIEKEKAVVYFKSAYEAAKMLEGKYSLHRALADKYENYVQLFLETGSKEHIWVKEYSYPDYGHCIDALFIPNQMKGPQGYSSNYNPTLDFVEMFDGLPRNDKGELKTKGEDGKCIYYDTRMSLFENAEPRLRASVILPGDVFKNEIIDVRRGIYIGKDIENLTYSDDLTENPFGDSKLCKTGQSEAKNELVDIGNGKTMYASGLSGHYNDRGFGTISGFFLRKFMDPNLPQEKVRLTNYSTQPWIELRYAEVLLNRAEAAQELSEAGITIEGIDLQKDAFECINDIRERGGAILLNSKSDISIEVIRKERKKELAFENKTWWDLIRWRSADTELNNRIMKVLFPYYIKENGKYVFVRRNDERNTRYTFATKLYYEPIPSGEIGKNPNLLPNNPGY